MRIAAGRVRSGFGLLAVLGLLALGLDVGVFASSSAHGAARPGSAGASCPSIHVKSPYAVAQGFILTAVERKDPRKAYALATPSLRRGTSCRAWLEGHVPVPKVADIDWKRSGYKPVAGTTDQLWLRIFLAQPNAALPAAFLMELRQQPDGSWQVGSFHRDDGGASSPALAA